MRETDRHIDTLRISFHDQQKILDELEAAALAEPQAVMRAAVRHRYAVQDGIVIEPEGTAASFVVRPRDLSASGISFLHGSFLYPKSACRVTLRTIDGECVIADGHVVRCRCIHGRVHEVGMRFTEPIDVENFVVAEEETPPAAPNGTDARHDPAGYATADIAKLAQQLQDLAVAGAARELLLRKVTQLALLLRNTAPAASPAADNRTPRR